MQNNPVKALNQRHFKILDLAFRGFTNLQIAKHLNMSSHHVSVITNSPSFQHQLAVRRAMYVEKMDNQMLEEDKEANELLKQATKEAAKNLIGKMHSTDERISIRAAESILDRSGLPKQSTSNKQNIGAMFVLSPKEANRIVEAIELDNLNDDKETTEKPDLPPSSDPPPVNLGRNTPTSQSSSLTETSQEKSAGGVSEKGGLPVSHDHES